MDNVLEKRVHSPQPERLKVVILDGVRGKERARALELCAVSNLLSF